MASTDGNVDVPVKRDIKNHLLFEIATEVANRGRHPFHPQQIPTKLIQVQLVEFIQC